MKKGEEKKPEPEEKEAEEGVGEETGIPRRTYVPSQEIEEKIEEPGFFVSTSNLDLIKGFHERYKKSDKIADSYQRFQGDINRNSYRLPQVSLTAANQDSSVPIKDAEGVEVGRLKMISPGYNAQNAVPSLNPSDLEGFKEISITRAGLNSSGEIANPQVSINAIYENGKCTYFQLPPEEYGISLVNKEGQEIPEFAAWKEEKQKQGFQANEIFANEFLKEKSGSLEGGLNGIVVCCTNHPQGRVSLCTAEELTVNMRSMGKWQETSHSYSLGKREETVQHAMGAAEGPADPDHRMYVKEVQQPDHGKLVEEKKEDTPTMMETGLDKIPDINPETRDSGISFDTNGAKKTDVKRYEPSLSSIPEETAEDLAREAPVDLVPPSPKVETGEAKLEPSQIAFSPEQKITNTKDDQSKSPNRVIPDSAAVERNGEVAKLTLTTQEKVTKAIKSFQKFVSTIKAAKQGVIHHGKGSRVESGGSQTF